MNKEVALMNLKHDAVGSFIYSVINQMLNEYNDKAKLHAVMRWLVLNEFIGVEGWTGEMVPHPRAEELIAAIPTLRKWTDEIAKDMVKKHKMKEKNG